MVTWSLTRPPSSPHHHPACPVSPAPSQERTFTKEQLAAGRNSVTAASMAGTEEGRKKLRSMMSGKNLVLAGIDLTPKSAPKAAPEAPKELPPLPAGWDEKKSSSGKTYFYNKATGKTSWERPPPDAPSTASAAAPAATPLMTPASAPTAADDEYEIADGWEEKFSKSKQKAYYYNTSTGETLWEKPRGKKKKTAAELEAEKAALATTAAAAAAAGEKEEDEEDEEGEEDESGESSSDDGDAEEESDDEKDADEEESDDGDGDDSEEELPVLPKRMPKGWEEHRTEEGAYYYFHTRTKMVQWEKPVNEHPHPNAHAVHSTKGSERALTGKLSGASRGAMTAATTSAAVFKKNPLLKAGGAKAPKLNAPESEEEDEESGTGDDGRDEEEDEEDEEDDEEDEEVISTSKKKGGEPTKRKDEIAVVVPSAKKGAAKKK